MSLPNQDTLGTSGLICILLCLVVSTLPSLGASDVSLVPCERSESDPSTLPDIFRHFRTRVSYSSEMKNHLFCPTRRFPAFLKYSLFRTQPLPAPGSVVWALQMREIDWKHWKWQPECHRRAQGFSHAFLRVRGRF